MISGGVTIDGSWEIVISVPDLKEERTQRVFGDEHIGGIMLKLVESLNVDKDWSDYALWMPEKNIWLKKTRHSLNSYGVLSDSKLTFTSMHKNILIRLPDLQCLELSVDFSTDVFSSVVVICKELGIRHPEELSLMRKLSREELKEQIKAKNRSGDSTGRHTLQFLDTSMGADTSLNVTASPTHLSPSPQGTLLRSPAHANSPSSLYNGTLSPGSMHSLSFDATESTLSNSPHVPTKEGLSSLHRPKNFVEKAQINFAWLDSSRTLMDQGVNNEHDTLLLRYKYFCLYDLNPKYDAIRVNQLYEQAKWMLLSEEIDCSESEMLMFAALQLQVARQAVLPPSDVDGLQRGRDDVDSALTELQESLQGQKISNHNDIMSVPELAAYVRYLKPKRLVPNTYRKYWAVLRDMNIFLLKNREDSDEDVSILINISGCEATPDVNIQASRYVIKLFTPNGDGGMDEVLLKFESETYYISWMAACKLASKGRTMADSSYDDEVKRISDLLQLQRPLGTASLSLVDDDIISEDLIATRFLKKIKSKQYPQKIREAHANVESMNLMEAKLAFIKAWEALPEFGISYFVIRLNNSKKDELFGIAPDRMMRMDLNTADAIKTWRYSGLRSWDVNWDIRHVNLDFDDGKISFACKTSDCKVVHEYIGGYIFMSMRSQDKNQALDRELFFKLTGGWL